MLKFCANVSWLFNELPFLERPEAARRAGFSGIEFHTPEGHAAGEIYRAARDAGLSLVLFNATSGDFMQGGSGLIGVPGRAVEFRLAVDQACDFGRAVGGALVQIGQSRVPPDVSREECMRVYVENLRYAARELSHVGCRVLVEPMNETDWPGVLVKNTAVALEAIAQAADPRIGLQFDTYHHHMSGADVAGTVEALAGRIAHLQFSSAPARQEPQAGSAWFDALVQVLKHQRYPHWVAAEYRPSRPTTETLGWLSAARAGENEAPESQ